MVCPTKNQRFALICEEDEVSNQPEKTSMQAEGTMKHDDSEEELPEVELEGSNLPICVVRRILSGRNSEDEEEELWLRTNTRVEHQGKALNLIIDNGSGMNIVSLDLVRKLNLNQEPHSKPYRVSWIDDTSIPIRNRCLVSFSLGKNFHEDFWCDVLPMKACHILLGRPWLYDMRVKYDGFSNSYSLRCGDKKVRLKPMRIIRFSKARRVFAL